MALTTLNNDELATIRRLQLRMSRARGRWLELDRCYRGVQAVKTLGLAIPPDLRGFEFPLNWNRVVVDSIVDRQDVKAFMRPGADVADEALGEGWAANNMEAQSPLVHSEARVQGRSYVSVSTNPDDADHPIITAETSRHLATEVDPRTRRPKSALRLYADPDKVWAPDQGTLYLPDATIWIERDGSGPWKVRDRDDHQLGRVALVPFLNRPRPGDWSGESEMADVMPIVDMATRVLANLQLAQEILATPKYVLSGARKEDFVGPDGKQKAEWDAYLDSIWTMLNPDAKAQKLDGADLNNFVIVIAMLAEQCSAVTGLPMRYFGQNPANPAAEGAIRADESRLVKNVERKNVIDGDSWGDVMALYERFRTGEWVDGPRIHTEWHDPGTPTFAQKADALQKLAGGKPLISREGAWDELGWSEPRKDRERAYFEAEASDPLMVDMIDRLGGGVS